MKTYINQLYSATSSISYNNLLNPIYTSILVSQCIFYGCGTTISSDTCGSAVYVFNNQGELNVTECYFTNCYGGQYGGAISHIDIYPCNIYKTITEKCSALLGNAIYKQGDLNIELVNFFDYQNTSIRSDIELHDGVANIFCANFTYLYSNNPGIHQKKYNNDPQEISQIRFSSFQDIMGDCMILLESQSVPQYCLIEYCNFLRIISFKALLFLQNTIAAINECYFHGVRLNSTLAYSSISPQTCVFANCYFDKSFNTSIYHNISCIFANTTLMDNIHYPYNIDINFNFSTEYSYKYKTKYHDEDIFRSVSTEFVWLQPIQIEDCLFYQIHSDIFGGAISINTFLTNISLTENVFSYCSTESLYMNVFGGAIAILNSNGNIELSKNCGYFCYSHTSHFALIRMGRVPNNGKYSNPITFNFTSILYCSPHIEPEGKTLEIESLSLMHNNNMTKNNAEESIVSFNTYDQIFFYSNIADNFLYNSTLTKGILIIDQSTIHSCNFINNSKYATLIYCDYSIVIDTCIIKDSGPLPKNAYVYFQNSHIIADNETSLITFVPNEYYSANYLRTPKVQEKNISIGALIGIIVSVAALFILLIGIAIFFLLRRSKKVKETLILRDSIANDFG